MNRQDVLLRLLDYKLLPRPKMGRIDAVSVLSRRLIMPQLPILGDNGYVVSPDLRSGLPPHITQPIGIKPLGTKADRLVAQTAKIEAGHVLLPKEAPWLSDFLNEVLAFPNGRHDDQVDSMSQFLNWVQEYLRYSQVLLVAPIVSSIPGPSWWGDWRGML